MEKIYSIFPEVILINSTFNTTVHGYNLIHIVAVDRFLRGHTVCFGCLSDLHAETIGLFVELFVDTMADIASSRCNIDAFLIIRCRRIYLAKHPWQIDSTAA